MKKSFFVAALGAAVASSFALGAKPLTFKLSSTSGSLWTQAEASAKPTLFVFLKGGCPSNQAGLPATNALAKQLAGKVQVVGVLRLSKERSKQFVELEKPQFPVLADPNGVLIDWFGAKHSYDLALIGSKSDLKQPRVWSSLSLKHVNAALASVQKQRSGWVAPTVKEFSTVSGCSL